MTRSPLARAVVVACGLSATLALSASGGSSDSPSAPAATSTDSASPSSTAPTTSSAPAPSSSTSSDAPSSPPPTIPAPPTSAPPASAPPASAPPASAASTSSSPAAAVIIIKDFTFTVPASVAPGSKVMVTNADSEAHTVTSKGGGFDVKVAGRGGTAVLTAPAAPGTYKLTCDFHANMNGSLTVK